MKRGTFLATHRILIYGILVAILLVFSFQTAEAALTADEYIAAGETQLGQQTFDGYLQAYQTFQNGFAEHPNDPVINAYLAFTRILDLFLSDEAGRFTPLASQFGLTWSGTSLDDLEVDAPVNDDGDFILPVTAPSLEELRSFLGSSFLNALDASIGNLDTAIGQWTDDIEYIVGAEVAGTDTDIEIDFGDLYLYRAVLKFMKTFALIISAYDLNVDSREFASMLNLDEAFGPKALFTRYQDLLKLLPTATTPTGNGVQQLADARTALIGGINDYLTASEKIRNDSTTTENAEELIEISECELLAEEFFRQAMGELKDSLENNRAANLVVDREETWVLTDDEGKTVEMELWFEGAGRYQSTNYDDCSQFITCGGEIDCTTIDGNTIGFEAYFQGSFPHEFAGTWDVTNQEGKTVQMALNPDGTGSYYETNYNYDECYQFITCGGTVDSTTIVDNPAGGYTIEIQVSFNDLGPHGGHATLTGTLNGDAISGGEYDGYFDTYGPFTPGTFSATRTSQDVFRAGEAQLTGTFLADADGKPETITAGTYSAGFYDGTPFSEGTFTGQRTAVEEETVTINFNPLFGNGSGPYNVRDMLPEFNCCKMPIDGTAGHGLGDDATLGGILPDMTQDEWDMEGFPCSTIQIPEATMNVQDGTVADWNGIAPVFTDQTGEDDPDLQGSDLDRLYLAKDETYLYVRMSIADGPPNTNPVYTAEWPYYQAMHYFVQFRTDPDDSWNIPYHGVAFDNGNWKVMVHEDEGMIVHYEADQGEAQAVGNDLEWRVPLEYIGQISGRKLATWIHWTPGTEESSDSNDTCNLIEPLASVTGTLTVPAYDGEGPIYIGVFGYDGSFDTDPDNCLRFIAIYPESYSDGMTYLLDNLPDGETVFLLVWWDEDFNGVMTPGDMVQRTNPFVPSSESPTVINLEPVTQYTGGDRPWFMSCNVQGYQTPEGISTAIMAMVFNDNGDVPDTITSLVVTDPLGTQYNLVPGDFSGGQYWHEFPGEPLTGDYTFTATNTEGNSATGHYYREKGTVIPVPDVTTLKATGNPLSPILSWGAVGGYEGNLFYRVRIFDAVGNTFWTSSVITSTSLTIQGGLLQDGATYKWRVEAFDGYRYDDSDNRSHTGKVLLTVDNETPFFSNVQVYHRLDGSGDFTAFEVGVVDPNGSVPGSIATLEVSGPEGFSYQFVPDDFDSTNTYYHKHASVPAAGIYTFTVTDTEGKRATSCDYVDAVQVPMVDATTLQAAGNSLTPTLSWGAPAGMDRSLYYRVIVEDLSNNRVWSSGRIADTYVTVPEGMLQGGDYQWYVRCLDDDDWIHFNSESRCAKTPLDINNSRAFFRYAAVYKLNTPNGMFTALAASVGDPDGSVPGTINSLTVTGPGGFNANLLAGQYSSTDSEFDLNVAGEGQPGVYTFTMEDSTGNTAVTYDYLGETDTVPLVGATTISFNGDLASPFISWGGLTGFPGHLYYRVRLYDQTDSMIYRSGREPTTARSVPAELVVPGQYYSARVEAQNHWTWGIYDSRSNSVKAGWVVPSADTTSISGRVTDEFDNGIPNVYVSLVALPYAEVMTADAVTDENGDYSFSNFPEGSYYVYACATCNGLNYVDAGISVSVGPGEALEGVDITLASGVSISGTVWQADGQTPVDGEISVVLVQGDPCGWYDDIASTAVNPLDGTFSFTGLPSGSYYLRTENNQQNNYLNEWWTESGSTIDCGDAQQITVNGGDVLTETQFQLDLGGSISGTLYEADGTTPIANCNVFVEEYVMGIWIGGVHSSENGNYIIRALPTGTYKVRAFAGNTGLPYVDEWYDDTYNWNDATPVAVNAPDDTPGIDFLLDSCGTITGTVYEEDGVTPIVGCHVYAESYGTGEWVAGENTDDEGHYVLRVPTGTYRVASCATCFNMPFVDEWYNDTYNYEEAAMVEVTVPNETSGIDFLLQRVPPTAGNVNGDGVIDLGDVILALKVVAGLNPAGVNAGADVDGDGKIGMAEILYILQYIADLRGIRESWEAVLYQTVLLMPPQYIGDMDFTLREHLDGSVTADGAFAVELLGQPLAGDFDDHPVDVDGNTLSTTYTDTITLPPEMGGIQTDATVNIEGTTNNGTADGTWSVDFETILLQDLNGTWNGTRIAGEGITE